MLWKKQEEESIPTSSAAENLHTQVKGVPELHRDDPHVLSSYQLTQPTGHRGPAHHPDLKHLGDD